MIAKITWDTEAERSSPTTLELWRGGVTEGELVWRERVVRMDTRVNMLDHYFLPHDRKGDRTPTGYDPPKLVHQPPATLLRLELEGGPLAWDAALEAHAKARERAAAELEDEELELRDEIVLELDRSGRARAILLRLKNDPIDPPEGWLRRQRGEAVTQVSLGGGGVGAATLQRLAALLPAGARPRAAWVRLAKGPDGRPTRQVVLPFDR